MYERIYIYIYIYEYIHTYVCACVCYEISQMLFSYLIVYVPHNDTAQYLVINSIHMKLNLINELINTSV